MPVEADVHQALVARGETVATAESLTGGRLAARLTATPGASRTYRGGVVTYATDVKVTLLGVSEELVAAHGVISADCAETMARRIRLLTGATYGLATTGVAGPDPQEGHPPGTVYVALAGPDLVRVERIALGGDRRQIQDQTCQQILCLLVDHLHREHQGLG